ncbi:DUF4033 domain-containing protein [Synechococcus sp. PCC 7336]|uniref:DUF4033 domain-containing protein n=1 Tax=Synechococcus sp. PCC 7336 TaxID=195250 RepID=UPI00034C1035|nr:DUF4033 domain-containing protein [Synechococcus sp. PCC 7336]
MKSNIDGKSAVHSDRKTDYDDSPFDQLLIWLLSRRMAETIGRETHLDGYDGFVDLSQKIVQGRNANEQKQVVMGVLRSLVPEVALQAIRTFFSPTQLVCELNAWSATLLFEWLVGPCEVKEVEIAAADGSVRRQKSGVHIKKCRYLEQSQCVGMCVNMCKLPTQDFFYKDFGIPLTMTPNFEDMSCEMAFGQLPAAIEDDPACREPCLARKCEIANEQAKSCPKLRG